MEQKEVEEFTALQWQLLRLSVNELTGIKLSKRIVDFSSNQILTPGKRSLNLMKLRMRWVLLNTK